MGKELGARVLVTGATGFVGQVLCGQLVQSGYVVRAALRSQGATPVDIGERVMIGDIATADWTQALSGVDYVLHAAARAHVLHDHRANADIYFETNARATARLANAAAQLGVRRFVYLSSVKVNGEENSGPAYAATDEPRPQDAYGTSKWHAEKLLMEVAEHTNMQAAIVRSPLVYGPGVKANFLRLLRWVDNGWPLPLGGVVNKRSLVSIWNLCDFLECVLRHPRAANGTWMVSDGEDLSTPDLIRRIGEAMHRQVRLLPIPVAALRVVGRLMGRQAEIARLCGSLIVDTTRTRSDLEWSAPLSVDEALARTVQWYLANGRIT